MYSKSEVKLDDGKSIVDRKMEESTRRLDKQMEERKSKLDRQMDEKEYEAYVKTKTPTHSLCKNMLKAFVTGGTICLIGQVLLVMYQDMGFNDEVSGTWTSITLIGISMILTGCNLYTKLANWGGAGALVPITGFANSVVSPAIEYSVEGVVNGIGTRIFVIAGPVILYGTFISWALGIVYYIWSHLWFV